MSNYLSESDCDVNEALRLQMNPDYTIWHKQRLLEEDRINEIVEYQLDIFDKTNRYNFLGCYYICKVNNEI